MEHKVRNLCYLSLTILFFLFALSGCSSKDQGTGVTVSSPSSSAPETTVSPGSDPETVPATSEPPLVTESAPVETTVQAATPARDATPLVLSPQASGVTIYGNSLVTIDASNTGEGYVMVNYTGSNQKVKLQLTGTDGNTYTYSLHGGYETFPLTSGSGSYTLVVYENISGTQYSTAFTQSIQVNIKDNFTTYLYPNQYVNFSQGMNTVNTAQELASTASTDLEVVEAVYNYVISNFTYDYDKAGSVKSGYIPNVDEILASKTGICFDYAAVMATMLRVERIPTRLEVGYRKDVYHAWVSIYLEETGWINGIIQFDGTDWKLMDPTFASTSQEPTSFTMDLSLYTRKFLY